MKCKLQTCHVTTIHPHHHHHHRRRRNFLSLKPPLNSPNPSSTPIINTPSLSKTATFPRAQILESTNGLYDDVEDIETEMEVIGKNSRRIKSRVSVNAGLDVVWSILTDYERLSDFIPGLAVSELVERNDIYVRLFQIGQQKLAFGINFNAKGIVDCYEKDLETLPFGQRRDIEFKMIEGDFQLFEGKWSIEQYNVEQYEDDTSFVGGEFHTTLSYVVDVEPKLWLPVGLVEGRLCREIKTNLSCIREEAHRRS